MVQTRSLLRPLFSPLPVLTRRRGFSSRPNVTHHFAARGVFTLVHTRVTGGRGTSGTPLHIITPKRSIWHHFLGNTSSVCQQKGKSLTALTQAGNSLVLFITQDTQKGRGREKEKKRKKKTLKSHINYAANMSSKW